MKHSLSLVFFNDTATTEIFTLSLHDALPISAIGLDRRLCDVSQHRVGAAEGHHRHLREEHRDLAEDVIAAKREDRKSTRLNSSHANISYAVFCLKQKSDHRHNCPQD